MKKIIVCLVVLLAMSCNKVNVSNIPYAPVYLALDLRYQDKDLVGLLNFKEITQPRNAGEMVGFSGILVVNGYDDQYYAYDLCCPHEANRNIKVEADNTGYAKCPKCGTSYEIALGTGTPNGVSEFALTKYPITRNGQELIIRNY